MAGAGLHRTRAPNGDVSGSGGSRVEPLHGRSHGFWHRGPSHLHGHVRKAEFPGRCEHPPVRPGGRHRIGGHHGNHGVRPLQVLVLRTALGRLSGPDIGRKRRSGISRRPNPAEPEPTRGAGAPDPRLQTPGQAVRGPGSFLEPGVWSLESLPPCARFRAEGTKTEGPVARNALAEAFRLGGVSWGGTPTRCWATRLPPWPEHPASGYRSTCRSSYPAIGRLSEAPRSRASPPGGRP
jgi:hypothetical protein